MRKFFWLVVLVNTIAQAQTNTYPTSGNVKIFATDQSWAEGVLVVKPSTWGGLRIARNDPSGGNYSGNWALGYNGSTGNDFSISTNYNGTQYDGLFHISNSTRYVGIGTTNPATKLHVVGTASIGQNTNGTAVIDAFNSYAYFGCNSATNGLAVGPNGNVGIGIAPTAQLHIADIYTAGGKNLLIGDDTFLTDIDLGNTLGIFGNQDNDRAGIKLGSSGPTLFGLNGNLGIGNLNPDAMLTVSGQVHAQEVKVTINVPGPDYVFENDYKLTSLEEIKNYIDQNKHLPEVPSAKEMERNGVQLGEMNMLLLKKIEELTLYVIEQNKNIEELNQRDISRQKEIESLKSNK